VARGGDGGYYDLMVHPMEPLSVRIAVSARY
jgi:hypothetical protein